MKIFKNLHIKFLAIICSLLLWFFVVGVENYVYQSQFEIPVKVVNLGQNVSVANEIGKVRVRYKAVDKLAGNINVNEFEMYLDAANLAEGNYQLDVNSLSKNPKIVVVAVEPAKIQLNLEAITSKEIKLKLDIIGKPAKEYELGEYKLSQDKVKVSGAASVLKKIGDLNLKVTLDGSEKADFSRKITLESQPEWNLAGKTVAFDPLVVQADIKVRKNPAVKEDFNLSNVIKTGTEAASAAVNGELKKKTLMVPIVKSGEFSSSVKEMLPQNLLVTVEGLPDELDTTKGEDMLLDLKTERISKGIYNVEIGDIKLPDNSKLKIVEFSPDRIVVKF